VAFGRRRFTRAVVVRPPLDFSAPASNIDLPAGTVAGSSATSGALLEVAQLVGTVAGSSVVSGAVSAPAVVLPAGSVVAASVVAGAVQLVVKNVGRLPGSL
jgi:hypothetical protein